MHDNCDLFYKEIPDGVSSLVVGYFNGFEEPVIITVGDCTVQVQRDIDLRAKG